MHRIRTPRGLVAFRIAVGGRCRGLVVGFLLWASGVGAGEVPSPESRIGFRPGDDGRLVRWEQVVNYFQAVDEASPRVALQTLGTSTEGRPLVMATISGEETMGDLDRFRAYQRTLSHPPDLSGTAEPEPVLEALQRSRTVVLVTCSIHSTETASTHMALELLHELATADDPATRELLDSTILLLIPSVNPDGVDKVAEWYGRTLGKPWEGSGLPWLYHKYAGHDTNRDWFMLNLAETRAVTRMLYREWFPTLSYDVHEMGKEGARMFVPPFYDPINPNLDPRLSQSIAVIGSHMAADLARQGKRGVLTHAMYDNWWNGGNRTTPQRHNIVGVLTESASVRLASPLFIPHDDLKASARGFGEHRPSVNFVDPWPGGWWRLRDIVEYQKICARSLLTLAARYRGDYQRQYLAMSRRAIEQGRTQPPFAWIVPGDGPDPARAAKMVRILHETGIEVHQANQPFEASGAPFPAGSWVLPAAQPYRPHLKDMMERQNYPARFTTGGAAEPPYDVAGWTLPLQMGVRSIAVDQPFAVPGPALKTIEDPPPKLAEPLDATARSYAVTIGGNEGVRLARELSQHADVRVLNREFVAGARKLAAGTLLVPASSGAKALLEDRAGQGLGIELTPLGETMPPDSHLASIHPARVGLYQPWVPSMDEGWTRLVLESFEMPYTTLHDGAIRAGGLAPRFDAIVIPSISAKSLREGWKPGESDPEFVGGLGAEGSGALREFVRSGGTIICLEDSCHYAIEEWHLPVQEVLSRKKSSEFYCPGSILRVVAAPAPTPASSLLTTGMPEEWSAYFDRSLAFQVEKGDAVVVARYGPGDPLESGWLLGPSLIAEQAALVDVPLGRGRIVLFGFPPQHRGQTHGTFRLLLNALTRAGAGTEETAR